MPSYTALSNRCKGLETRIAAAESKLTRLERSLRALTEALVEARQPTGFATTEDIARVAKRVRVLEDRLEHGISIGPRELLPDYR